MLRKYVNLPAGVDIRLGVAFRSTSSSVVPLSIATSGDTLWIWVTSSYIAIGSGSSVVEVSYNTNIILNDWNYVEWKMQISNSITANSCVVKLNGVEVINMPEGSDTMFLSSNAITRVDLWGNYCYYDDFYIADSTGSTHNDLLGVCKVKALRPASDGTYSDGVTSTGTSHYSLVNNTGSSIDVGVRLLNISDKESYYLSQITTATVAGGIIQGLQMSSIAYNSGGSGFRSLAGILKTDTDEIEVNGIDDMVQYSPGTTSQLLLTDINSSTWTVDSINSTQFGVVVK
jgi:hypothetical protein